MSRAPDVAQDLAARLGDRPVLTAALATLMIAGMAASVVSVVLMWSRRPRLAALRARPWHETDAAVLAALLAGLFLVAAAVVATLDRVLPGILHSPHRDAWVMAAQSFAFHWPALGLAVYWLRSRRRSWTEAFGAPGRPLVSDLFLGAFFYLAIVCPAGLAGWAGRALLDRLGLDTAPQEIIRVLADPAAGAARWYLFFLSLVLAPVAEEIVFRGIALPAMTPRFGPGGAVLLTATLFAAVHGHAAAAAPIFVLGLGLAMAYLYSGSLAVPIVMHATFNGVSVALSHLLELAD